MLVDDFGYPQTFVYLQSGVTGYIAKSANESEIQNAIHEQLSEHPYLCSKMLMAIEKFSR
jgi:DNA-binding NarL/FixJ family response regulator